MGVSKKKLVPGEKNIVNRPGSYVVFMREWVDAFDNSFSDFFCQNWKSPSGTWEIVYDTVSDGNPDGACWLDYGQQFHESVLADTFKPEIPRSMAKFQHVATVS